MFVTTDQQSFNAAHFQRALAEGGSAAEAAARQFVRAYARRLRSMHFVAGVATADVEDLVAEVMAKVVTGIHGLRHPERFDGWIGTIAENVRNAYWIRIRRDRDHLDASWSGLPDAGQSETDVPAVFQLPDPGVSDPLMTECIERQLSKMSKEQPRHYACIELLVQGLSRSEIAQHLGRTGQAAGQFISQSCAYAYRFIERCYPDGAVDGRRRGNAAIEGESGGRA